MLSYVGNVQVMKIIRLLERLEDVESSSLIESGALICNTGENNSVLGLCFETMSTNFFNCYKLHFELL